MTFAILGTIGAAVAEAAAAAAPEIAAGAAAAGEAAAVAAPEAAIAAAPEAAATIGTGSFIGDAAALGLGGTAETAVPVGSTMSSLASGVGSGTAGEAGLGSLAGAMPVGTVSNAAAPGIMSTVGNLAAQQGVSSGIQGIQTAQANAQTQQNSKDLYAQSQADQAQQGRDARQLSNEVYGFKGFKPLGKAGGGELNLEDGQFIIPADVVSALGNGSTKAGAKFLDEFFGRA